MFGYFTTLSMKGLEWYWKSTSINNNLGSWSIYFQIYFHLLYGYKISACFQIFKTILKNISWPRIKKIFRTILSHLIWNLKNYELKHCSQKKFLKIMQNNLFLKTHVYRTVYPLVLQLIDITYIWWNFSASASIFFAKFIF